jgi:hypothetical protein
MSDFVGKTTQQMLDVEARQELSIYEPFSHDSYQGRSLTKIDEVADLDYTKTQGDGTMMHRESKQRLNSNSILEQSQAYKKNS